MEGLFVTATDTEVGKTTICAGLLKMLYGSRPVAYWKPIQTGTVIGDDTQDVRELTELGDENFIKPSYRFADPLAAYLAARNWKQTISIDQVIAESEVHRKDRFMIVEGGGGLLVPITETTLQDELIAALKFPVVIVSPNRLGTINQTLLTIRACRRRDIPIKGVILTRSREAAGGGNAECISKFGEVDILGEFMENSDRRAVVGQVGAHPKLRSLFGLSALPN